MTPQNQIPAGLTPENAVLLLIDHQAGLLSMVRTQEPDVLKGNLMTLANLAKIFNIPVILTTSESSGPNGPYIKEVTDLFPQVQVINRTIINAWEDQRIIDQVKQTGRTHLIMAAILTDVCLAFPAIAAANEGYVVHAVLDASGTTSNLVQEAAMLKMSQAGVKTSNWMAISAELQKDWALPTGQQLMQLYGKQSASYSYLVDLNQKK